MADYCGDQNAELRYSGVIAEYIRPVLSWMVQEGLLTQKAALTASADVW